MCARACSVVSDSLWPHGLQPARLLCPSNSPGKNPGVGCHFLLQGIFPTQDLGNNCTPDPESQPSWNQAESCRCSEIKGFFRALSRPLPVSPAPEGTGSKRSRAAVSEVSGPHTLQLGNFTKCYKSADYYSFQQAKETFGGEKEDHLGDQKTALTNDCRITDKIKTDRSPGLEKQNPRNRLGPKTLDLRRSGDSKAQKFQTTRGRVGMKTPRVSVGAGLGPDTPLRVTAGQRLPVRTGRKASGHWCPRTAHLGYAGAHQPTADDRHVLDEDFLRWGRGGGGGGHGAHELPGYESHGARRRRQRQAQDLAEKQPAHSPRKSSEPTSGGGGPGARAPWASPWRHRRRGVASRPAFPIGRGPRDGVRTSERGVQA